MLHQIDLKRADLNLLVLFDVVLAERHVGRAAERLSLSSSAVSHGLGRLRRLLNDPLFLKTPRGVVPTSRAEDLAGPVADVLARARSVISTAEPFDPGTSTRRFTIGAPDGISAVVLPPLFEAVKRAAPGIDIGIRQILPAPVRVWQSAIDDLDARALDLAVVPIDDIPARFAERVLYEEDFVVAMRAGHRFRRRPTLEGFCAMEHLVVSLQSDAHGFVDDYLTGQGHSRRIALTVPSFMFALAVLADTDLICALPRTFVAVHGRRFGIVAAEMPVALDRFRVRAIVPDVALMDAGVRWLFDMVAGPPRTLSRQGRRPRRRTIEPQARIRDCV